MSYSRQNPEEVYRSKAEPVLPLFDVQTVTSGNGAPLGESAKTQKPTTCPSRRNGESGGAAIAPGFQDSHSRRSDPLTSHQAAEAAQEFASSHCGIILAALKQYGPMGKTKLSVKTQISDVAVARRLADLEKMNLAKPTGDTEPSRTNRQERIWCAL